MSEIRHELHQLQIGVVLSVLTLLYGFGLGIAFGAAEDSIKGTLQSRGEAVLETAYESDKAKMNATVKKSWVYFKRAHLHANGMGTSALAMIFLLAVFPVASRGRKILAAMLGFGGLTYALYWMLAGLRAPGMGSTGAAKASLEWLAIPSSGMFVLATIAVFVLCLTRLKGDSNT